MKTRRFVAVWRTVNSSDRLENGMNKRERKVLGP